MTRNIDSGQGINTNYPLSTMPGPRTMTTLTSVTPSSGTTSVVKKVATYPAPRSRTTNQEGPTVTPITQSLPQMQGMNSENIKNGRDIKATPRSEQNLSYPTPPRSTGWYLSPPPGWKPPTYTDALADPERYPRVDPRVIISLTFLVIMTQIPQIEILGKSLYVTVMNIVLEGLVIIHLFMHRVLKSQV